MTTLALALATARLNGLDEWALIRDLRDWRGFVAGDWNEGQVALARWMLGDDVNDGESSIKVSRMLSCLSDTQAIRLLTGEAEPAGEVGAQIAALTENAVALRLWRRPCKPPFATTTVENAKAFAVGVDLLDAAKVVTVGVDLSTKKDVSAVAIMSNGTVRHVQLDDHFDLLNGSDGLTIVGHGQSIKIPLGAAAKLHGGLGQMLSM